VSSRSSGWGEVDEDEVSKANDDGEKDREKERVEDTSQ
jgi:hypothetical protein